MILRLLVSMMFLFGLFSSQYSSAATVHLCVDGIYHVSGIDENGVPVGPTLIISGDCAGGDWAVIVESMHPSAGEIIANGPESQRFAQLLEPVASEALLSYLEGISTDPRTEVWSGKGKIVRNEGTSYRVLGREPSLLEPFRTVVDPGSISETTHDLLVQLDPTSSDCKFLIYATKGPDVSKKPYMWHPELTKWGGLHMTLFGGVTLENQTCSGNELQSLKKAIVQCWKNNVSLSDSDSKGMRFWGSDEWGDKPCWMVSNELNVKPGGEGKCQKSVDKQAQYLGIQLGEQASKKLMAFQECLTTSGLINGSILAKLKGAQKGPEGATPRQIFHVTNEFCKGNGPGTEMECLGTQDNKWSQVQKAICKKLGDDNCGQSVEMFPYLAIQNEKGRVIKWQCVGIGGPNCVDVQ